ncbi:type II and III secretion system protein [Dethiosulfovibrio peptidovorans DSM 11002]|uniref:Type II and III secretion system protein n=1 Tax=Dethiosulfovibrio peptidovorans DSM 11002 TaxID=469381 RepID=D2Z426_9BACT|nr:type II and III secretion system protein [Dethiosulfovibrio peptidovorans]EFC92287.1 type II and III secretion system protein [Dethiosulfovibrio peptidovorans DSM 11002]
MRNKTIAFFVVLFAFIFAPGPLFSEPLPPSVLSGIMPQQVGADRMTVTIQGMNLPRPEVMNQDGGFVDLIFKGTTVPSSRWERLYNFPILSKVEMDHVEGGLRVRFVTGEKIALHSVKGDPPCNRILLDFRTVSSLKRDESAKKLKEPRRIPVDGSDPFQTNRRISVDFRSVDIQDVFRMLADMMKVNIVLDPSVAEIPPLTMRFDEAPLREVFGYLMRLYGLSYAKVGKTLVIGSPEGISKVMGEEKTRVYDVAYSDVKTLPDMLGGLTTIPKEKITVDERLGRLFVKGSENQLSDFERVLQTVDDPGKQVMLRARIIEIKDEASDELETMLNAVYKHWWLSTSSSGAEGGYSYVKDPDSYNPPTGEDRPGGIEFPGIEIPDIGTGGIRLLDTGLKALVTANKGKVLANPSVITVSGQKASIKLVENLKYISARDDAGNPTYSDEEVGPKLEFTPLVGRDGVISVELSIATGEVIAWKEGNQGEEFPQTSEREVVTSIRVRDGEPFVVGGLFNERHTENTTKIPILGDIPLLGEFFKSKSKTDDRTEVVMVVIPYILNVTDGPIERWDL